MFAHLSGFLFIFLSFLLPHFFNSPLFFLLLSVFPHFLMSCLLTFHLCILSSLLNSFILSFLASSLPFLSFLFPHVCHCSFFLSLHPSFHPSMLPTLLPFLPFLHSSFCQSFCPFFIPFFFKSVLLFLLPSPVELKTRKITNGDTRFSPDIEQIFFIVSTFTT